LREFFIIFKCSPIQNLNIFGARKAFHFEFTNSSWIEILKDICNRAGPTSQQPKPVFTAHELPAARSVCHRAPRRCQLPLPAPRPSLTAHKLRPGRVLLVDPSFDAGNPYSGLPTSFPHHGQVATMSPPPRYASNRFPTPPCSPSSPPRYTSSSAVAWFRSAIAARRGPVPSPVSGPRPKGQVGQESRTGLAGEPLWAEPKATMPFVNFL
jgi:hypothetical protein